MTLVETPEYQLLADAMQDWPDEALQRVASAPAEKWCAKYACRGDNSARCLLGHAEDWRQSYGVTHEISLPITREHWYQIGRTFDGLFLAHGAPVVLVLQAAARRILEVRR